MYFIVEDCPKGLCNSMWAGLNIYAYCLQHCYSVSIPAFEKHQKLFDLKKLLFSLNQPNIHKILYINKRPWYLNKFFLDIIGLKSKKISDSYSIIEKLFNIRRIKSWKELSENSNKHFIENREFIRTKIFPYSTKIEKINSLFSNDNSPVLGMHLRGGDYRDWRNGKYFFNEDLFINFITKYLDQNVNRKCFIATNESKWSEILIDNFGEKIIIGGDEISDLWGLANSNWIIGPPSTFSMFASFWKNTPLRIMLSPKDYNDLFMPEDHILALNIFSSGKHLIDENGIDFKLESNV